MHPRVKLELQHKQREVIELIQGCHDPEGLPGAALTAMISTIKLSGIQTTQVILIDGVVKSCGHIWGNEGDGWIISVLCFYNADWKAMMRAAWDRRSRYPELGSHPPHVLWSDCEKAVEKENLRGPDYYDQRKKKTKISSDELSVEYSLGEKHLVVKRHGTDTSQWFKCSPVLFQNEVSGL